MNDFGKIISLAKVFTMAMSNRPFTISGEERDAAFEGLKVLAEHRNGWSEEQKEIYKIMVDFGNEATK
jgi:hypothetical protein